ncbi:hypothetical protein BW727_100142 [Jeotgalibaca dankookensis]|uniref:Uncharacterized protein n=1 Tax=Jeotgalibaca dankookensis TaxID=708126 RepID=A0A1S6ILW9_9LACT|nr:hypothetical protein [Jeotgalibaca dankookensis]AQS52552.1 hypothetical protein BW727_100142 [Jeotgalibaca dankookensis]
MLPEKNISLEEFMRGLSELQVIPHLRLRRSQSGNPDEHDLIFLVCTQEPNEGAHIGRVCLCCIGNASINDYEGFKDSMSTEHYDAILNLLFNFTYTDVKYKAINK